MHNNYYLIRQVVPELKECLVDFMLFDCFSQNKNEIVFQFINDASEEFTIIAHLNPKFTCLAFPKEYNRAKKNTAPIFKLLHKQKVLDVNGFINERAFVIHFDNNYSLLFKLFGQQANVLLLHHKVVIDIFRNNLQNDYNINLANLPRPIDQGEEAILNALPELKSIYPTLDRHTRNALSQKIANISAHEALKQIQSFITQLENPTIYSIIEDDHIPKLSLLPTTTAVAQYYAPLEALTQFFRAYLNNYKYYTSQREALKELELQVSKTKTYIAKTKVKKEDLLNKTSYREIADLIMANLHLIKPNTPSVDLLNFYTNTNISIKINPRLSPQRNAENYYRKSKNMAIEVTKLEEAIKAKEILLEKLMSDIQKVSASDTMTDLRKFSKSKTKETQAADKLPFKQFILDGYTIYVGKNAKQNDLLTLKFAKKDDFFFHAKDVSGSHVILKQISGKSFPASILEKTAAIAAYYSKRKTDTLCPVGYTPKKYVRKPKGSPPGLVLVEREKVLLVKPQLPD